jgi:hypothetical protein
VRVLPRYRRHLPPELVGLLPGIGKILLHGCYIRRQKTHCMLSILVAESKDH